jgi:serine/threonine protein kinase
MLDVTCSTVAAPRQQLVDVLERYVADLEKGMAPDQQALLDANPELAEELLPYLESLRLLNSATRDMRSIKIAPGNEASGLPAASTRQIGDYKILREIGRGGMGIVYEAHQSSLNRQVALKILPFAAVLDQRQIARFRNEAQAAAQLHHPHIVPVFAVGQEQGVYFYAMQFIDGQALDQAIADLRSATPHSFGKSTRPRGLANGSTATLPFDRTSAMQVRRTTHHAEFFRTVARLGKEAAEALRHAHEHGIVHRDVKPSNLLLDSRGKLWVTDFGLARIQNNNGVTLTGDVVGTLRYMSPEQASGSTLVDARTDVYSLGVTLYELLTQTLAFAADDRQSLLRQIMEDEPTAPRKLNPAIPTDLETIVLGSMAKLRDERYESAQSLADDLGRFLDGKPTHARRPTLLDRSAKWTRRHRSLVALTAFALLLLSVVSATGLILLAREQARTAAALTRAQENFQRAEKHFLQARAAVDHFGVQLSDRLVEVPGAEPVRRDLLLDSLHYYQQFAIDAGNDASLRQETAIAHFKSAVIAARLGAVTDAAGEYETSQKLLTELLRDTPTAVEARAQLGLAHNNLGLLYASSGKNDAARTEYAAAIAIQQQLLRDARDNATFVGQLAESQANLGLLLDQLGDNRGAQRALESAVNVLRPLADLQPNNFENIHNLAIACNNLSYVLRAADPQAAEAASQEAITILEHARVPSGDPEMFQDDLALCYNNLAALKSQPGHWDEAIASHRHAIDLQERMVRKSPSVVRYRSDLAVSLNNLGVAYCRASQPDDADAAFHRARELFAELAADYPDLLSFRSSLAAQLNNQALALSEINRHAEAISIYREAISSQESCRDRAPDSATVRELLSKMYYNYGQSLRAVGRWDESKQAALSRRKLWSGNGERLLGVAAELAELDQQATRQIADKKPSASDNTEAEIISTMQQAFESGWPRVIDLDAEPRFACFKSNKRFADKIAELNDRSLQTGAQQPARPSRETN